MANNSNEENNIREEQENENYVELLGKNDIMKMFRCESDKALRILKMMHASKMATKVGREYYTDKKLLDKFLTSIMGKELHI